MEMKERNVTEKLEMKERNQLKNKKRMKDIH